MNRRAAELGVIALMLGKLGISGVGGEENNPVITCGWFVNIHTVPASSAAPKGRFQLVNRVARKGRFCMCGFFCTLTSKLTALRSMA